MDTAAASKPRLWRRLFNAVGMGWEVPPIAMDDDPRFADTIVVNVKCTLDWPSRLGPQMQDSPMLGGPARTAGCLRTIAG